MNFDFSFYYTLAMSYLPSVLLAVLTLVVGFWIIAIITGYLNRMLTNSKMESTVTNFLCSLVSVGLKVMLLLNIAKMLGIETTSFVAIFAALSFAIGTALSGNISHFASGVILLIFRPYKKGDLVTLQGHTGVVEEVATFSTILMTLDNKKIMIPNGMITGGIITNISGQGKIRVDMTFGVANSADVDRVRAVIQSVSNSCPTLLPDSTTDIYVQENQVGITQFAVRPWCASEHYWTTYFYFQEYINKAFKANGIPAPKPGMDVVVKNA